MFLFLVALCRLCVPCPFRSLLRICLQANGVPLIVSNVYGLFGFVFCDFGAKFEVEDATGEPLRHGVIEDLTQSKVHGTLVNAEQEHKLRDGASVVLFDVAGAAQAGGAAFPVKVVSDTTFCLGSTVNISESLAGGVWREVRRPETMHFTAWGQQTPTANDVTLLDPSHAAHVSAYWLAVRALSQFRDRHERLPRPAIAADLAEIASLAHALHSASGVGDLTALPLVLRIAGQAAGAASPMATLFGGLVAHELVKAVTRRGTPLHQWLMHDALACLPSGELSPDAVQPRGSRYDGQIALFGHEIHAAIADSRFLVLGVGAVGCELLKALTLMGVGTGPEGAITLIDSRTVEAHHLPSQVLYRPADVGKPKCDVAAAALAALNPHARVRSDTAALLSTSLSAPGNHSWTPLTGVCDAIDTEELRNVAVARCIFWRKALLAATAFGCKAAVQV